MKYSVRCHKMHTVSIERKADGSSPFDITVDKSHHSVAIRKVQEDGTMKTLMIDHKVVRKQFEDAEAVARVMAHATGLWPPSMDAGAKKEARQRKTRKTERG